MRVVKFPSWRANRTKVEIGDVISVLPDNELVWSMLEFDGRGIAPDDLSISEFEKLALHEHGYVMSWDKLKKFAVTVEDTHFCLLLGAKTEQDIINDHALAPEFFPEHYPSCEIFIEAFDSYEWTIWARDAELMQRMAAVYESQEAESASETGSPLVRGGAMSLEDSEG